MQQTQKSCHTNKRAGPFPARRPTMFPKLSLSVIAALALSAAAGGVARADATPTSMDQAAPKPHSPTNAEINAAEVGNPASPDYRNRPKLDTDGNVNAEWQRLDADTPANPDPDDR